MVPCYQSQYGHAILFVSFIVQKGVLPIQVFVYLLVQANTLHVSYTSRNVLIIHISNLEAWIVKLFFINSCHYNSLKDHSMKTKNLTCLLSLKCRLFYIYRLEGLAARDFSLSSRDKSLNYDK